MKQNLLALGLCVSAVTLSPFSAVAQIDINWSALFPGDTLKELEPDIHIRLDSLSTAKIVDANTEPPNPFDDLKQSVVFASEAGDGPRFEAFIRAFPDEAARQGSFSMQFRIVSGTLTLQTGHNTDPWDPIERASYGMTSNYFGVSFQPDTEINIRGIPVQTSSVVTLEPNVDYTFTVKWDFENAENCYTFFLNGERINSMDGMPYARVPDAAEADGGVTGFRILLGNRDDTQGEVFIGKIQSIAGPVDLFE